MCLEYIKISQKFIIWKYSTQFKNKIEQCFHKEYKYAHEKVLSIIHD